MITERNILKLEQRRRIYNIIQKDPGLSQRDISRLIDIPRSTLRYHLKYLIKQNFVTLKKFKGCTRYFISDKLGRKEKELLDLLRKETPRRIILCLYALFACSQIEFSKRLEKSPATIEFYLRKLLDSEIIELVQYDNDKDLIFSLNPYISIKRKRNTNEKLYRFKDIDAMLTIHHILKTYKDSLEDQQLINNLIEVKRRINGKVLFIKWDRFKPQYYKKANTLDGAIDSLLEVGNELFRPFFML